MLVLMVPVKVSVVRGVVTVGVVGVPVVVSLPQPAVVAAATSSAAAARCLINRRIGRP